MLSSMSKPWKSVKNASVIFIITLLIWYYADQSVLLENQPFEIPVVVKSNRPDRYYVAFAGPPYQRSLMVTMRGSRKHLEAFSQRLRKRQPFAVPLDELHEASPNKQEINSRDDLLDEIPVIRDSRLTIQDVEPQRLDVIIDDIKTWDDIPVQPDFGELSNLGEVGAKLQPRSVSVRLPGFVANDPGQPLVAIARAEQAVRATRDDRGEFRVQVPLILDLPEGLDPSFPVRFRPDDKVRITGRIEVLTETKSIGPIQITWSIPDEVQKRYVVNAEPTDFRVNIDVTGPKEIIDQLEPADFRGMIEVFAGDVNDPGPGKDITREAKFFFVDQATASGCTIASEHHEFRFKLEPRSETTVLTGERQRPRS